MTDKTKSLFLENYFPSNPNRTTACVDNSAMLSKALNVCHTAAGNRWANFLAVDYYQVRDTAEVIDEANSLYMASCRNLNDLMFELPLTLKHSKSVFTYAWFWGYLSQRSTSKGVFAAVDTLNGQLQCGCEDIRSCAVSLFFIVEVFLLLSCYYRPDSSFGNNYPLH